MKHLDLFSGYTVSDTGEIWSRRGRLVKQQISNVGYLRVELWRDGIGRKYSVHRLVAEAFVLNPDGHTEVNHLDGDKTNNHASNLEWTTRSGNQKHAYRLGLQIGYKKSTPLSEAHKRALCGSRWRGTRRQYVAGGMTFGSPEEAARYHGVNRQTVYNRAASPNFTDWQIQVWREEK